LNEGSCCAIQLKLILSLSSATWEIRSLDSAVEVEIKAFGYKIWHKLMRSWCQAVAFRVQVLGLRVVPEALVGSSNTT